MRQLLLEPTMDKALEAMKGLKKPDASEHVLSVLFLIAGLPLCFSGYRFFDRLLGVVAAVLAMLTAAEVLDGVKEKMGAAFFVLVLLIGLLAFLIGHRVRHLGFVIAACLLAWLLSVPLAKWIAPLLKQNDINVDQALLGFITLIGVLCVCQCLLARYELALIMLFCSLTGSYLTTASVDHILLMTGAWKNECFWPSTLFDYKHASNCSASLVLFVILALLGVYSQRRDFQRSYASQNRDLQHVLVVRR
eukprot:TRINITY_DN16514_c0_g1_i1.p1 TRINITY_DN16514_c0_g1~~TRINITY_DN16514_c0_g1_i1.p1  ORF type:complete len:249 (-),score=42.23 TRINITY_DN16514_c0_g1_i1:89-835(-)